MKIPRTDGNYPKSETKIEYQNLTQKKLTVMNRNEKAQMISHKNQTRNHLNEAIMEDQPQEFRGYTWAQTVESLNSWFNNLLSLRTSFIVVIISQRPISRKLSLLGLPLHLACLVHHGSRWHWSPRKWRWIGWKPVPVQRTLVGLCILILHREKQTQQKHQKAQFSCEIHLWF